MFDIQTTKVLERQKLLETADGMGGQGLLDRGAKVAILPPTLAILPPTLAILTHTLLTPVPGKRATGATKVQTETTQQA